MAGWRLESFKMLTYLLFPVGAFIYFNHPAFYERTLKETLQNMSTDINFDSLALLNSMSLEKSLDNLDKTIEELETDAKSR